MPTPPTEHLDAADDDLLSGPNAPDVILTPGEALGALEAAARVHAGSVNPKDLIGSTKVPLNLIPPIALAHMACAFLDGALKYGPFNWRKYPVQGSIYTAAVARHMGCWADREDFDPESLVHNLGHAMACCAILLDAEACGNLADDRPDSAPTRDVLNQLRATVDFLIEREKKKRVAERDV